MKLWKRLVLVALPSLASGALLFACDVEDEAAGKKPTTTPITPKGSSDASADSDAPTEVKGLCPRAGGPAKVASISDQILSNAQADCRIGAYFSAMGPQRRTHVTECMRAYLQDVFDCPNANYPTAKSSAGECRSLQGAHNNLVGPEGKEGLNKADFQAYKEVATAAMKTGGLTDDDIASVMSVFIGVSDQVAPRQVTDYNTNCTCPNGVTPAGPSCLPDGGYILPDVNVPDVVVDAPPPDTGADVATD